MIICLTSGTAFILLIIFLSYKLWRASQFKLQLVKLLAKQRNPVKTGSAWPNNVDGNSFDEDLLNDQEEIFSPNPYYEAHDGDEVRAQPDEMKVYHAIGADSKANTDISDSSPETQVFPGNGIEVFSENPYYESS